jgi:hypothetical protein
MILKIISEMLSRIGNYNHCTVDEYKKAMTQAKADMDAQFDNMIANIDTDFNGKVSVKETGKAWLGFAKGMYKAIRSNSTKYWGKV